MGLIERKANDIIAITLRTRICLHANADILVLHEGKIAEEFGVSRTPIRQVLQTLAHEHLVETRPGIGTIATPLDEGMFERDLKTAQSMLSACAAVAQHPTPRETRFTLTSLLAMSKDVCGGSETRSVFLDIATKLLDALVVTVTDPLVANAYVSSYWRIIRWRIRMFDRDPDFIWERMITLITVATEAANASEPGAIFMAMAEQAKSSKFAHGLKRPIKIDITQSNVQNIR